MTTDILLIGASVRAAAESAVRAGWRVWAVDLFGDEDLKAAAYQYRQIEHYRQLPAVISDWPRMPWLITGAMENHPKLLARLAQTRLFWGNPPEVIRAVRNPIKLLRSIKQAGLPALDIWPHAAPPPLDGRWLLKPRQSAGGQNIAIWNEAANDHPTLSKGHYFQKRAFGEAVSALFLSEALIGTCRLLTVPPFGYGGAIGPIRLSQQLESQLIRLGQVITEEFSLRGLWGIDGIVHEDRFFLTEVNPRYTASVELYELAYEAALLPSHPTAFQAQSSEMQFSEQWQHRTTSPCCWGKVVLYATQAGSIPDWGEWQSLYASQVLGRTLLADRPTTGSQLSVGYPICSLLACGETEANCRRVLAETVERFRSRFEPALGPVSCPPIAEEL